MNDNGYAQTKSSSAKSVIEEATKEQGARREMDAFESEDVKLFGMHAGGGGIFYMDHNSEFWDEVSHKKLGNEGVKNARLDEIKPLYAHGEYEEVPEQEC